MKGHLNWRGVLNPDRASRCRRWVGIFKVHGLEGIRLKVDFLTVNCDNIQVKHGAKAIDLVVLASLVVAGQDQLLFELAFSLGLKRNVYVDCSARVKVKL